jgi:hypothetical protein
MQNSDIQRLRTTQHGKREIKIRLISTTFGDLCLHDITDPENQIYAKHYRNFSISSGVSELPKAEIEINISSPLDKLKKDDYVIVEIKTADREDFFCAFSGSIKSVKRKFQNQPTKEDYVKVTAYSEFYKLENFRVSQSDIKVFSGFREIINHLIKMSGILYLDVIFDENIDNEYELSYVSDFSVLSLIKNICFQKDLICSFGAEGLLEIMERETALNPERNAIPVITLSEEEILSGEVNL